MYEVNIDSYISNICTSTILSANWPLSDDANTLFYEFNNFSGLIDGSMYLCPQAIGNAVRDLRIWYKVKIVDNNIRIPNTFSP